MARLWPWNRQQFETGVVVQAGAPEAMTPPGASQDLVELTSQVVGTQALPILNPDPLTLELLFTHSNELGTIEQAIRRKLWRQGLKVRSRYAGVCNACGVGVDQVGSIKKMGDGAGDCPKCLASGTVHPPHEAGKLRLEAFLDRCNLDQDTLMDVGEDATADGIRQGRMVLILRHHYQLNPDGTILSSRLKEVRRGAPGYIRIVRGDNGRKGGKHFICLPCRSTQGYKAEPRPQPCTHCNGATYDAWYVEMNDWSGGQIRQYYLPTEVHEAPLYYRDGTPPALRIWHQAWFFVFANYYARMAFDPRGNKRPDKIIAVLGANMESLRKWLREEEERKRADPYRASTMALNAQDITGGQVRMDAKVLDLGDETIKGKAIELREAFLKDLRGQFGMSPVDTGDTASSGGLNNEGLQMRVSSEIVEMGQGIHRRWLRRVSDFLGEPHWEYYFDHPFEEDDAREAEVVAKQLEIADRAEGLGLQVRWEAGRAIITDGAVERKPMDFAGLDVGPLGEGAGSPLSKPVKAGL